MIKFLKITPILFIFLTLSNCQIKKTSYNHGLNSLENKSKLLLIGESNMNDVKRLLGSPQSKSLSNNSTWLYFERTFEKGKIYDLGKNHLTKNNILKISFNVEGILQEKKFIDKDSMNSVKYSKGKTQNPKSEQSFVNSVLSSVKQKMYNKKK